MSARHDTLLRLGTVVAVLFFVVSGLTPTAMGQTNNECDEPGEAPDVIMPNIYEIKRWGVIGDITAFSVGTYSCNIGTCWAVWYPNTNQHPVIAQNAFRLKGGKFEQIGQSWLKHGFYALSGNLCGGGCIQTGGEHLGVNCSDPYSAGLNGDQDRLGPKFEVNAFTGYFPYPATDLYQTGDTIYKRLQIHNDDLDPALNLDAKYYVESMYVAPDDAAAGNHYNNAGYREVLILDSGGTYNMQLVGETIDQLPAIMAWQQEDPAVEITVLQPPGDGMYFLAAKASETLPGVWHYEYAIENLNSHRAAREFRVPILPGTTVMNVGFHDVEYHSGEPTDGTDWSWSIDDSTVPNFLVWETDAWEVNADANALRWNTLYNFRFDVQLAPRYGEVALGLFLPGSPERIGTTTLVPALCNENGLCDPGEEICACLGDCEQPVAELVCDDREDNDCDGVMDCLDVDCCVGTQCDYLDDDQDDFAVCYDCDDSNSDVWDRPAPVQNVRWQNYLGQIVMAWDAPSDLGGARVTYEVVRSLDPADFVADPTCLQAPNPSLNFYYDFESPEAGSCFCYLPRALNECPGELGEGGVGEDSQGNPRPAASCP